MKEYIEGDVVETVGKDKEFKNKDLDALNKQDKDLLERKKKQTLAALAAWLALHPRKTSKESDSAEFKEGLDLFKKRGCLSCHAWEGDGGGKTKHGPDCTGYGDAQWI